MVDGNLGDFVMFCIVLGFFFEGVNGKKRVLGPKINFDVDYGSTEFVTKITTFDSMQI